MLYSAVIHVVALWTVQYKTYIILVSVSGTRLWWSHWVLYEERILVINDLQRSKLVNFLLPFSLPFPSPPTTSRRLEVLRTANAFAQKFTHELEKLRISPKQDSIFYFMTTVRIQRLCSFVLYGLTTKVTSYIRIVLFSIYLEWHIQINSFLFYI